MVIPQVYFTAVQNDLLFVDVITRHMITIIMCLCSESLLQMQCICHTPAHRTIEKQASLGVTITNCTDPTYSSPLIRQGLP